MRVTHLRHVVIGAPDPGALADFYSSVWGLRQVASGPRGVYLRGAGTEHHILVIRPASRASVMGYGLALADRDAVDKASRALSAVQGVRLGEPPTTLEEPGGGYGFSLFDVDGRTISLSSDVALAPPLDTADDVGPSKISHLVVNSPRAPHFVQLFVDLLGFRVADEMPHMLFLRCNSDHHSVAVVRAPHASLNHLAFEVPNVQRMLRGLERMQEHGFKALWGPGRHGPGNNAFAYFLSPNRQVIEYTAEVEQVSDESDAVPRMWLPENIVITDAWADPNSARPTPYARELMLGAEEEAVGETVELMDDEEADAR